MKKVPCEIFSRVVGYFRPVNNWNKGKQEEFLQRKNLNLRGMLDANNSTNEKEKNFKR